MVWNLVEVIGVIFYTHFIFVRFLVPVFRQFGQKPMTPKVLVLSVFGCMLPGTLALLCGFYCLLHSWMNAFAEMLQFADRLFYKVRLREKFILLCSVRRLGRIEFVIFINASRMILAFFLF